MDMNTRYNSTERTFPLPPGEGQGEGVSGTAVLPAILLLLAVMGGCATQHVSTETDLSGDEMAVVHGSYWGSLRWHKAAISGYDDEDFGLQPVMMLKLLPGDHTLHATCFSGFGSMTGMFTITSWISFHAEAAHSYQVLCDSSGSGRTFWIKDRSDGTVVGGTAPP